MINPEAKILGDTVVMKLPNEQIVEGLKQKLKDMGKVVDVQYDENYIIFKVSFEDIEKKYNEEFKRISGTDIKAIEIETKEVKVRVSRRAIKVMLEKFFKGMSVVDYGDGFEISGRVDISTLPFKL